jgi:two-component system cell cycle response regulator
MKSKRVLIVDDDNFMRQIIKDSLAGQFDVIEARHGHEAVRFADSKKPDLILLDIELPGLSGIDVCKRLKATRHTKNIPVILISSHTRKEQIIIGLQAGADDYLTKPFNSNEVLSRVNAHLNYEMFYQDLEKGDLQLLLELYDSISVLRNPVKILNMVVKKVADIIGVDRCSIVGINDKNEFTVKASNDLDMQEEIKLDLDRYPEIQKAHETRQAVVVNDATKDPLMEPVRSQMEQRGLNSIFVIPIIKKDSVIGTLFLGTATKLQGGISDRVYQLCHLVANISANVLENAILFESMKTAKGIFEDLEIRDGLTRLHSHRFFYDKLEKEFSRTTRYKTPLSLIFIDIDDFRKINDTYGHLRGDEVLKQIAVVIREIVRDSDVAARYGGEEFSVLLPNTGAEGALTLAKRISSLISELKIAEEGREQVTVSVGLSSCEGDQNYLFDQMVQHAEQAMKKAKAAGKNQIMVYDHH